MRRPIGGWFVASVVAVLLGIDQITKLWVQTNLKLYSSLEIIPQFFWVSYYTNHGAVGGIGRQSANTIPLLVVASALLIAVIVLAYRYVGNLIPLSWRMNLFVALSIAPLLSHAIDRLRQGYVVDFLHFAGVPVLFNFADVLPDIAIVLLALETVSYLRIRRQARAPLLTTGRDPEVYS